MLSDIAAMTHVRNGRLCRLTIKAHSYAICSKFSDYRNAFLALSSKAVYKQAGPIRHSSRSLVKLTDNSSWQ